MNMGTLLILEAINVRERCSIMPEHKRKWKKKKKIAKEKMSATKKILIAAIIAINLFTTACLVIQYLTQQDVSSTLIEYWFNFWTVEIFSMAGIKISKLHVATKLGLDDNTNTDTEEPVSDNEEDA